MRETIDTLVWVANFPATYGYAWVFIGGFGLIGFLMLAFRSRRGGDAVTTRLLALRAERGMTEPGERGSGFLGAIGFGISRLFFCLIAVAVLGGGAIGLASLIFGPVTSGYIYDNGVSTEAEALDSDHVRFTAQDGETYTLPHNFFTRPSYPEDTSVAFADTVVVRYLPGHPQAYVLDTRASLDSRGLPVGDL